MYPTRARPFLCFWVCGVRPLHIPRMHCISLDCQTADSSNTAPELYFQFLRMLFQHHLPLLRMFYKEVSCVEQQYGAGVLRIQNLHVCPRVRLVSKPADCLAGRLAAPSHPAVTRTAAADAVVDFSNISVNCITLILVIFLYKIRYTAWDKSSSSSWLFSLAVAPSAQQPILFCFSTQTVADNAARFISDPDGYFLDVLCSLNQTRTTNNSLYCISSFGRFTFP